MRKTVLTIICIIIAFTLIVNIFQITESKSTVTTQSSTPPSTENHIRIMSYNILSDSVGYDGLNATLRNEYFKAVLEFTAPHILALQEASFNWQRLINNSEIQLKSVCPVRYSLSLSMTVLLYNPSIITLLSSGTQAFRYARDTRLRCYTWALFQQKNTSKKFFVVNTHLSLYEKGPYIPLNQAVELVDFIEELRVRYNYPVILAGDFNSKERHTGHNNSAVYEYTCSYMNDCRYEAKKLYSGDSKNIYSATNDYIFSTDDTHIESYTLLSDSHLKVISDHYPIYTDILIS